ncbi:family 43 glycosylhydrolase [Echinicola sp. 20G]|uniref:family 43 glycosylhydrolase n=1 Tax=Echinicola sp. 20G TaxID=2781961 RepID=UPI0019109E42|nr:family 43 glycosylhydrolase [Echinicola sp. 20G]
MLILENHQSKCRLIFQSAFTLILVFFWSVNVVFAQNERKFNPILPDNIADPSIAYFDGTYYLYGTTDIDQGLSKMGPPVVWTSKDFVNWSFEGTILENIDWNKAYNFEDKEGKQKSGFFRYWAPGRPIEKDGKYYLWPTIVKPDDQMGIYVMVADHPTGPFKFLNGEGLSFNGFQILEHEAKPIIDDIDAEVFVEEDGTAYIYWRRRKAAKLNEDWTGLEGEVMDIQTSHGGYSEGPTVFKRNDIYYYLYTLSGHANYKNAYMISKEGPLGPFEAPDGPAIFIHSDGNTGVWGPGHGNIFHDPQTGKYIFAYLEYGEGGTTRQVFANEMKFNSDGTIKPIQVDFEGIGYLGNPSKEGTNVAFSAKASASSSKKAKEVEAKMDLNPNNLAGGTSPRELTKQKVFTYEAKNATDESNYTRWVAEAGDENPWLQIDLGKKRQIKRISLAFVHPVYGHAFEILGSEDGENWKKVHEQSEPEIKTPHDIKVKTGARYLKVIILAGHPGIWEMKVY